MKKKSKLNVLLEDTPLTYYWIGFLLADGNFGEENLIKVGLASLDKEHLIKLQKFLNIDNITMRKDGKAYYIKAMDTKIISILCKKFDIKQNKTYFPPNINSLDIKNKDLMISLIAGFIDGDGSIRPKHKGFSLTIKCHGSWIDVLDFFCKKIKPDSSAKINSYGYAHFSISNDIILKELKRNVERLNLPVLKRKWDLIDLDYIKRKNLVEMNFKKFKFLYKKLMAIPEFKLTVKKFIDENK